MKGLRTAFGFLTIIPIRQPDSYVPGDLGRAAAWFPLVGLAIGAILGLLSLVLRPLLPAAVAAVGLVAAWAFLTGGLHLDGLADCGDGLLAAVSRERRLEIMRDPRLGTFGGMALVMHLLLKVSLVAALLEAPAPAALLPILAAPVLGRWLILLAARQPMARPGGLGAEFGLGLSPKTFLYAAVVPLGMVAVGGVRGVLAAILAHVGMLSILRLARSRLGGVTGDVLGLTIELGESLVLLAFVVRLSFPGGIF